MKKLLVLLFSIFFLSSPSVFAEDLDKKDINEMRTFYIDGCKEEVSIGVCECLFDYSIDAGYTKEELLWSDLTYDYREAKGISETNVSEDRSWELIEIMMNSMSACM